MTEPIHKEKDLPLVWVIHLASSGDSEAMEQVLRYYDDYMSRLCTRTLYDKNGTPHVCVDTHMKRCLEIRLIRAVMRAICFRPWQKANGLPFPPLLMPGTDPTLTKKASGQHKADGYDLSVWSRSAGAPRPCCKSAGWDPYQTGERQN